MNIIESDRLLPVHKTQDTWAYRESGYRTVRFKRIKNCTKYDVLSIPFMTFGLLRIPPIGAFTTYTYGVSTQKTERRQKKPQTNFDINIGLRKSLNLA